MTSGNPIPKVSEFDKMLASHDAQITVLGERIGSVETKIDTVLHDLRTVSNALTAQSVRPAFDLAKIITTTKDIGILVGFTIAAIIYVTNASFSGQFSEIKNLRDDLNTLEQAVKGGVKGSYSP